MKVDWNIESYQGGEGVLHAYIDSSKDVVTIIKDKDLFVAHIYEHEFSSIRETKIDNSLLELMNWAEEELKFRSSHASK